MGNAVTALTPLGSLTASATAQAVEGHLVYQAEAHVVLTAKGQHFLRIGAAQAFFAEDAVDALGLAGKQFQHRLEARQQRGLFSFIMHMSLRAVCIGRRAA